jgi:hypothetical protein
MGFAAARERITPRTTPNAATTCYEKGCTALKSTGEDRQGTLLPYRTYSTHAATTRPAVFLAGRPAALRAADARIGRT